MKKREVSRLLRSLAVCGGERSSCVRGFFFSMEEKTCLVNSKKGAIEREFEGMGERKST